MNAPWLKMKTRISSSKYLWLASVLILLSLTTQIAKSQTCRGSYLDYLVRDARGKVIDPNQDGLWVSSSWEVMARKFAKPEDVVPTDISALSGKLAIMHTSGACRLDDPQKLELTLNGKSMNLIFHPDPGVDRTLIVDSLPFQQGTFEIDLPAPTGKPTYFPAKGWKKVSDNATAVAPYPLKFVRGAVIDSVTGKPIAGASVSLDSNLYYPAGATTDANGLFDVKHLRADRLEKLEGMAVVAVHPDYAGDFAVIFETEKGKPFDSVTGVTLKLIPLVTVSGRVVDETTGVAPPGADKFRLWLRYGQDKYLWNQRLTNNESKTMVKADGTFSIKTGPGKNSVSLMDDADPYHGYDLAAASFALREIEVAATGSSGVVLKVKKRK